MNEIFTTQCLRIANAIQQRRRPATRGNAFRLRESFIERTRHRHNLNIHFIYYIRFNT